MFELIAFCLMNGNAVATTQTCENYDVMPRCTVEQLAARDPLTCWATDKTRAVVFVDDLPFTWDGMAAGDLGTVHNMNSGAVLYWGLQ